MKNKIFILIPVLLLAIPNLSFSQSAERKIIIWNEGVTEERKAEILERADRSERVKDIDLVRASVVNVRNYRSLKLLEESGDILRIDDDPVATTFAQTLPWGVDRIDAEKVWPLGNNANPVKVGVIDTGISTSHPDLLVNIKGGVNTISSWRSYSDDNGHGSHVAGTIASLSNTQGVIGVAPQADLYSIKVLDSRGSGYYSDIIEGIQWAINNKMQVINMSLGGSANYTPLHDAVKAARNAGIVVVAAAGNSGGTVSYPAAYAEVIAVSAIQQNNNIASFSSRGSQIDLAAPGVSIYSTYKGKNYATLSGTSMAAPHVAGAAALLLNSPVGSNDSNGNNKWDPAEVETKLKQSATDLGTAGNDTLYGAGLVNIFKALQ
jgi:subtilisin